MEPRMASSMQTTEITNNKQQLSTLSPDVQCKAALSIIKNIPEGPQTICISFLQWNKALRKPLGEYGLARILRSRGFPSQDGETIIHSATGTVKIYDLNGKCLYLQTFNHDDGVMSAIFNKNNQRILTLSYWCSAKLWNTNNGECLQTFNHRYHINSAVFNKDDLLILTASNDRTAKIWGLDGTVLQTFNYNDWVPSAVFNKENSRVLTSSYDKTAKIWDLGGNRLQTFNHDNPVISAVFNNDNSHVLTASCDHTAKIWDLDGKCLQTFNHGDRPGYAHDPIKSAIFNKDNSRVLTVSLDAAKLWDLDGNCLQTFKRDGNSIDSTVFNKDDSHILIANHSVIKLWERIFKEITYAQIELLLHIDKNRALFEKYAKDKDRKISLKSLLHGAIKIRKLDEESLLSTFKTFSSPEQREIVEQYNLLDTVEEPVTIEMRDADITT